jgi:hypothetical protein
MNKRTKRKGKKKRRKKKKKQQSPSFPPLFTMEGSSSSSSSRVMVRYETKLRDCFVNLPPSWASLLFDLDNSDSVILRLTPEAKTMKGGGKQRGQPSLPSSAKRGGDGDGLGEGEGDKGDCYVGWSGVQSSPLPAPSLSSFSSLSSASSPPVPIDSDVAGYLEINPTFATGLGLREWQVVKAELIPSKKVTPATKVFVDPLSPDDWEILVLALSFLLLFMKIPIIRLKRNFMLASWRNSS